MFSFQGYLPKDINNIEQEWETISEVFPELSKDLREPATIPLSSSSTSHTKISSTTNNIYRIACTNTSQTHPHTTYYLHHTNPITSTTISHHFCTHIFPKQSHPKKTKKVCSHHFHSNTHNDNLHQHFCTHHLPRNKHVPKRQKNLPKSPSQKKCAPTLNILASSNIRLKHYKKSSLSLKHHKTSFTTHLITSSTSTTTTKSHPTQRCLFPP